MSLSDKEQFLEKDLQFCETGYFLNNRQPKAGNYDIVFKYKDVKGSIKKLKESISKDLDNSDFPDDIKFAVGNMVTEYIDEEFGDVLCTSDEVKKDE